MKQANVSLISTDNIQKKIYTIRGVQVMLDEDLAVFYNVSTKRMNKPREIRLDFPINFVLN